MCGISVVWGPKVDEPAFKSALTALKARGPDDYQLGFTQFGDMELMYGFTRLHIQGAATTEQPFVTESRIIMCNGEIFNALELITSRNLLVPAGSSDCAVIPALLDQGLTLAEVARCLDGDFAIVVIDLATATIQVARDPYGVRPLFCSCDGVTSAIASELKGLAVIDHVTAVDPGTVVTFGRSPSVTRWHQVPWLKAPYSESTLRTALVSAVHKRMATVRSIGACLSGGLDSSLVAAIAARVLAAQGSCLDTYSIGMEGSPDLAAARVVAEHIGSRHHERVITADECLSAIPRVIRAIESYDITTVRASVGNYLLAEFIAKVTPAVKVVLNGDGADEALGGYLYMRAAPDNVAWENETDRLLQEIHRYDVLRSERSMAAFGLESRSPFLDRQFVAVARAVPTELLRSDTAMEKSVLRKAFEGFLPNEILWRRKEAFSDGISRAENSWFEMARAKGARLMATPGRPGEFIGLGSYSVNPPPTAEAAWYRTLFHTSFPPAAASVIPAMWMPRFITAKDPSARTLSLYDQ